jgi:uncharacterized membrane protein YoaK (UPF0700 family)
VTPETLRNTLLLALAGAAGCVDAVSYLQMSRVFTANMTGHTVLLGIAVVEGQTDTTLHALLALAGFVVGALTGSTIADREPARAAWPHCSTQALALESAVLVALAVAWALGATRAGGGLSLCIFGAAFAMGIQSAAARTVKVHGISTTFITGTLTSLCAGMIARRRHGPPDEGAPEDPHGLALLLSVWGVYVAGAVVGAALAGRAPALSLVPPAVIVLVVTAIAATIFGLGRDRLP